MKRKWKEILNNDLAILPSHDSGPLAHPELSSNSVLLSLCWSQSAMLSSYNSLYDSK